jgi:ubiquinol-cytochrome c reductase cytochrome b subunit
LLVRQIHYWAALLFIAAVFLHLLRVFFTGAFRKPRELNWLIGLLLLVLGAAESYTGHLLPDDLLSGTGLRVVGASILSIPVIGTWTSFLIFGGPFPRPPDHRPALHHASAAVLLSGRREAGDRRGPRRTGIASRTA